MNNIHLRKNDDERVNRNMEIKRQEDIDLQTAMRNIRENPVLGSTAPKEEKIRRHLVFTTSITRDDPSKRSGLEVRYNIRERFCIGQDCPIKRVISKLDPKQNIDQIRGICRRFDLEPGNRFYGHVLSEGFLRSSEQLIFTADCKHSPGDEQFGGISDGSGTYTNCGSLMVTDRKILMASFGQTAINLQTVRAQWVMNNFPSTNPPIETED